MIWVRRVYAFDLPHQWIGWPNWPTWRWAQMSPECIGYRDVEVVHHSDRDDWRLAA